MNWTLLHKYLSEECSPEEMQKVEDWLHSDEDNLRLLKSLQKIWAVEPNDEMETDGKSAWDSFQHKISPVHKTTEGKPADYRIKRVQRKTSAYTSYKRAIAIALSSAAVVLFVFLFSRYTSLNTEKSQPQFAMQKIVTAKGQQTTFRLSDGTRIQLNADSKIEIPKSFGDSTRKVFLRGEAYFEVVHDSGKPFSVHAGKTQTRVLGTKFGIRAYPEEKQVQVAVSEGKVALSSQKDTTGHNSKEIESSQIGIFAEGEQAKVTNIDNIQQYLGWKDGQLIFNDTPLREVRPQLERWFDITCVVADSLLDERRLTASFNGEPVTEVLNVVALSMDMSYEREGREITFSKR